MTEECGNRIADKMDSMNLLLAAIADNMSQTEELKDWETISAIVRAGLAPSMFPIGTRFIVPWTDTRTDVSTVWDMEFDVVHHGNALLQNGNTVPAMYLQSHYTLPFTTPFDAIEAQICAVSDMPAGTYHFTLGSTRGYSGDVGKTFQFTTTQQIPAGGQIVLSGSYNAALAGTKAKTYSSPTSTTQIEEVTLSEGSGGTDLGSIATTVGTVLNNPYCASLGNNLWSESAIRQFLNSEKAANAWWSAKNAFDRPPSYLSTSAGFMSGFEADFLNAVGNIQVKTQRNYVTGGGTSGSPVVDTDFEKFFLPSAEQHYFNTYLGTVNDGTEGTAWDYWKQVKGDATPWAGWQTYPELITYGIDNKASARAVWLRSATRNSSCYVGSVYASGSVDGFDASNGVSAAPACAIV